MVTSQTLVKPLLWRSLTIFVLTGAEALVVVFSHNCSKWAGNAKDISDMISYTHHFLQLHLCNQIVYHFGNVELKFVKLFIANNLKGSIWSIGQNLPIKNIGFLGPEFLERFIEFLFCHNIFGKSNTIIRNLQNL